VHQFSEVHTAKMYARGYSETSVVTRQGVAQPRRPQTKYLPLSKSQKSINLCPFFRFLCKSRFGTQI